MPVATSAANRPPSRSRADSATPRVVPAAPARDGAEIDGARATTAASRPASSPSASPTRPARMSGGRHGSFPPGRWHHGTGPSPPSNARVGKQQGGNVAKPHSSMLLVRTPAARGRGWRASHGRGPRAPRSAPWRRPRIAPRATARRASATSTSVPQQPREGEGLVRGAVPGDQRAAPLLQDEPLRLHVDDQGGGPRLHER
jgi:hypothetical protein